MRFLARNWRWQAACSDEGTWKLWKTIRVIVLCIDLTLAHLIQRDRPELNRLQFLSLELNRRDDAFPYDRFQELCRFCQWQIKYEITQIVEDRPVVINFHTLHDRRAMHHYDVRACIYFCVRPFLDPIRRH